MFQSTAKIFEAVTAEIGPVEVWHDYLSVPQWQTNVQQAPVAAIPQVYSFPPRTAVHLDGVDSMHLKNVYENRPRVCF